MKVRYLQARIYAFARLAARRPDEQVVLRFDLLRRVDQLRRDGLTAEQACRGLGLPRATYYRWRRQAQAGPERLRPRSRRPHRLRQPAWSQAALLGLERLRRTYPMWGKAKLVVLLKAEGFSLSESTVGRMLKHLLGRGRIDPVPLKRTRNALSRIQRRRHALRLPRNLKPTVPGAIVQLDTLTVSLRPGFTIRQFTAYDPVSRFTVAQAFERATSRCAKAFLHKLTRDMPFKIAALQVDGGSEFRAEFETACQQRGLALYVLPPKSPKLNGAVERANSAWRYEFYATYDMPNSLPELTPLINDFQRLYNHHRPHGALNGLTPAQYLRSSHSAVISPSHIS